MPKRFRKYRKTPLPILGYSMTAQLDLLELSPRITVISLQQLPRDCIRCGATVLNDDAHYVPWANGSPVWPTYEHKGDEWGCVCPACREWYCAEDTRLDAEREKQSGIPA